jgi:hypothetical protein
MTSGWRNPPREEAEHAAIRALTFLAEDEARLDRFLRLTGVSPEGLRERAARPAFLAAVLEHLLGDETLLLTFAANTGIDPAFIAHAHRALEGAEDRQDGGA